MQFRHLVVILTIVMAGIATIAAPDSVRLNFRVINNFPVKFVTINMNDPEVVVTTAVAASFPRGLESWGSFLQRLQPDAAINGTYFCPHSCMPVGDVAVDGALLYRGVVGTALCITPDNHVAMLPGPQQAKPNWTGYRTVLCAGPRLLTQGRITIDARAEGFRDPRVLGSASRSAVAWRPDGLLIFLTVERDVSLMNLAYICQGLGAVEAMTLDGGSSSGLYADGRTVTRPGRSISNILAVYSSRLRFQEVARRLAPPQLPRLAELIPPVVAGGSAPVEPGTIAVPAPPRPVDPKTPIIWIERPDGSQPIRGTVPITVKAAQDERLQWTSLQINGQLRAITNIWPLEFLWDSTKEQDGDYVIEVTAWTGQRTMLERKSCRVQVRNAEAVAQTPGHEDDNGQTR